MGNVISKVHIGTQSSSESIFQSAKASQGTGDLGKAPTLTKLPTGLSVSPQQSSL